jgi:hypothetical protein
VTNGPVDRILWQRLDKPGLERCEIRRQPDETLVAGIALVAEAETPYRIDYTITTGSSKSTDRTGRRWHASTVTR